MEYVIDKMTPDDWEQVCSIYQEGIATGHSTFEADTPDWGKWNMAYLLDCRLVARDGDAIMGWTPQGGIFPENIASLALVKKHGFREIGRRKRLGKMTHGPLAGIWRDVILLERRSQSVGIQ